ncbi:sensor histidine kinase [Pilimelia columellifera]|uniref:Sensor-like histidine kinase SenX3 n=1 Tax=Pilimelia columellifera subsp. columellifera TaxID=706583 RepID=A0ABP6A4N5_9ACTN
MTPAVTILDDPARIAELHEYGLLDAPADRELEAVLRAAAAVAGVSTATINLIDATRQCQITTVGFQGADSPRAESMCAISLAVGGFVHAPDASADPRFAANPWVDGRIDAVRLYAAAPLVTPTGHALGTLCVFDAVAGHLDQEQRGRLEDLAMVVVALFERRRQARIERELADQAEAARMALARAHTELQQVHADLSLRTRQLDATVNDLRRSNEELQAFAAVASHDLKAPLAVIGGYLEEMAHSYRDRLDAPALGWLATMRNATYRMDELINSLLGYAQAGATVLRAVPTSLGDLVGMVLEDVQPCLAVVDARVEVVGELPVVLCDPVLVRQLLQNLIANAVKFSDPDRPPRITIVGRRVDGGCEVAVADNGSGIPADDRARIFTMFSRLNTKVGGHGIGLATCQRIVERHGGQIRADETPGGGTTIHFTLVDQHERG